MIEKKAGRTPSSIFVDKYKNYLRLVQEAKEIHENLQAAEQKLSDIQDEINIIQDAVMEAKVVNDDEWRNYNEVKFRLIHPPKELVYTPKPGERSRELRLELVGADDYQIKAVV